MYVPFSRLLSTTLPFKTIVTLLALFFPALFLHLELNRLTSTSEPTLYSAGGCFELNYLTISPADFLDTFLMETLAGIGLLACRFANALINANARRIGYVALGSVKLIRVACLLISLWQELVCLPAVSLMR